jgi:hypothetical protein
MLPEENLPGEHTEQDPFEELMDPDGQLEPFATQDQTT